MITKIKDKLYNNEDKIKELLEEIGCTYIKQVKNDFKFGRDDNSSGNANVLDIDTLHYKSFSKGTSGDIITLVGEMLNKDLGNAIKWLANKLHIKYEYKNIEVKLPFGGFWKDLSRIKDTEDNPSITYPMSRNNIFSKYGISKLFIEDGISALVQEEFGIGYSLLDNRITIPWFNCQGELVGIVARLNKKELTKEENKYKYFPEIPFNKGKNLYGLYQNYNNILLTNTIIVCESEKSVLKAREYGYKNVVAIGCNNISAFQAKLIKSMCCTVIIALDEGISLKHCGEQSKKCKISNPFFENETYIVDMTKDNNSYITKDKVCIFDLDKESVDKILQEYLIYID